MSDTYNYDFLRRIVIRFRRFLIRYRFLSTIFRLYRKITQRYSKIGFSKKKCYYEGQKPDAFLGKTVGSNNFFTLIDHNFRFLRKNVTLQAVIFVTFSSMKNECVFVFLFDRCSYWIKIFLKITWKYLRHVYTVNIIIRTSLPNYLQLDSILSVALLSQTCVMVFWKPNVGTCDRNNQWRSQRLSEWASCAPPPHLEGPNEEENYLRKNKKTWSKLWGKN